MLQDKIYELCCKLNENEENVVILPQTVKRYASAFRSVIRLAVEEKIIDKDPFTEGMKYPKIFKPNIPCLDRRDYDVIVQYLTGKVNAPSPELVRDDVMLACGSLGGLRRGEMVALTWSHIENLDSATRTNVRISIARLAYQPKGEKTTKGNPKSVDSVRTFTIPKLFADVLWRWREDLKTRGVPVTGNSHVLNDGDGEIISIYSPTKRFKPYLSTVFGQDKDVTLHSLRHTFASMLSMTGTSPDTIRDVLGHDDLKTTQIYLHALQLKEEDLMKNMNDYHAAQVVGEEEPKNEN